MRGLKKYLNDEQLKLTRPTPLIVRVSLHYSGRYDVYDALSQNYIRGKDGGLKLLSRDAARALAKKMNSSKKIHDAWLKKEAERKAALQAIYASMKATLARSATMRDDMRVITVRKVCEVRALRKVNGNPRIVAFKRSTDGGQSPHFPNNLPKLVCKAGAVLRVPGADTRARTQCGAGVNVADAKWVFLDGSAPSYEAFKSYIGGPVPSWEERRRPVRGVRFWRVTFHKSDIAAIPQGTDGKFRVFNALVVEELSFQQMKAIVKGDID